MDETDNNALVDLRDVSYSVPSLAAPIIDGLNLKIERGETLVLLGESGCGKTTTLKLINRLYLPTKGQVLIEGKATTDWDPIRLRRKTGYVIQEGGLFPHFTVAENISLVPRLEGWEADRIKARVQELLTLVGLDPQKFSARYPNELSGGQRQRIGVARGIDLHLRNFAHQVMAGAHSDIAAVFRDDETIEQVVRIRFGHAAGQVLQAGVDVGDDRFGIHEKSAWFLAV